MLLAALCCEPLVPIWAAMWKFINLHVLFHKMLNDLKAMHEVCCLFPQHLSPKCPSVMFCSHCSWIKNLEVRHESAPSFPCTGCSSFLPESLTSLQHLTLSNYLLALLFPQFGSLFSLNLVPVQLWTPSLTAKDETNTQHQPWGC